MAGDASSAPVWPELTLSAWDGTRDTVHLWTQVVGKVRLALEPTVNHWWQVPLYVSVRGLTTSLMHAGGRGVEIEFDLVRHELVVQTTDGQTGRIALDARTVADFYTSVMAALEAVNVRVSMLARPVEMEVAIPFAEDTRPGSYDPVAIHRFWRALVQVHRVFTLFRSRFTGKASPVHFFWGAFDLATSRFSGRPAPRHPGGVPNCADWVMHEAYSHEVSSCGFWPGGSAEGSFYSYAYPEPSGFAAWEVRPPAAAYDPQLGEFLLAYEAVRTSDDPDAMLLEFLQSTYEAAADLGRWDRPALERPLPGEPTRKELGRIEATHG